MTPHPEGGGAPRADAARWMPALAAIAAALVTWGALQADVRGLASRVERLERHDEELQRGDREVLQRLAAIEGKLESLRELLARERRAAAVP